MKTRYALLLALASSAATYAGTKAWEDPLFQARVSTAILGFQNPVPADYQATETTRVHLSEPMRAKTLREKVLEERGVTRGKAQEQAGKAVARDLRPPEPGQIPCAVRAGDGQSIDDAAPGARMGEVDELHVVGIYEPTSSRRGFREAATQEAVSLCLDRPGHSVMLVLGSYEPTAWRIEASEDTEIAGLLLAGYGAKASTASFHGRYATGDVPASFVEPKIPYAYKQEGQDFRQLARTLPKRFGTEAIASFHGAYTAPAAGFHIDEAEDEPTLKPDYLKEALYEKADTLPEALKRAAIHGREENGWRLTEKGFTGAGDEPAIPAPEGTKLSWTLPHVAEDREGKRLFGARTHVYSNIYRGDLETGAFTTLTETRGAGYGGILYDAEHDRLVVTRSDRGGRNSSILMLDPETGLEIEKIEIDGSLPGITDLYDPGNEPEPRLELLAIEGDMLVVTTDPARRGLSARLGRGPKAERTWVIDLASRQAHLLSYRDAHMPAPRHAWSEPGAPAAQPEATPARPAEQPGARPNRDADRQSTLTDRIRESRARREASAMHREIASEGGRMIRTVMALRSIFASRDGYSGISSRMAMEAGLLRGGSANPWGGTVTIEGDAEGFVLTSSDIPGSDCAELAAWLRSVADQRRLRGDMDVQCKGGGLSIAVR